MQPKTILIVIINLLFVSLTAGFATNPVDSLNQLLQQPMKQERKVDILNQLGDYYVRRQYAKVSLYTAQALEHAQASNYIEGQVKAYNIRAEGATWQGLYEQADADLVQAKKLAQSVSDQEGLARNNLVNGIGLIKRSSHKAATVALQKALAIYQKLGQARGIWKAYNVTGQLYAELGEFEVALSAYKKALNKAQELKDIELLAKAYNNIATVYESQSDYSSALQYYKKALTYAELLSDKLLQGVFHNNIGMIYEALGDYERAKRYYNNFLNVLENFDNQHYLFACYDNLGSVYLKERDYSNSLDYYQKALQIAQALNHQSSLAIAHTRVGKIQHYQGQYEASVASHQEALAIFDTIGQQLRAASCKIALAESYKYLSKYEEALEVALSAYEWAQAAQMLGTEKEATEVIAKLYQELEDYEKAYAYHRRYKLASDSLKGSNIIRKLEVYKINEEQKLADEKEQLVQQARERVQSTAFWLIGGSLSLLLLLGSYSHFTTRRKNKEISKQHEVLQLQTEKLKQLNTTKDKLFAIISHDLRGPIGGLEHLLSLLLSKELSKEEFLDAANDLKQNTTNIHQMLNNLLQWAYAQMKEGIAATPVTLNPNIPLQNVLSFLQELARAKQLHIDNAMPQNLWVKVDPEHLNLIFRNLISNAIKFTDSGGLIRIDAVEEGAMVMFSVKDTGIGMSETQIQEICQGKSTSKWGTAGEKGVGLGLVLCKEVVLENGGTVNIESVLGEGSTFYFSLPIAPQTDEQH